VPIVREFVSELKGKGMKRTNKEFQRVWKELGVDELVAKLSGFRSSM
jgi:hypothetical protein